MRKKTPMGQLDLTVSSLKFCVKSKKNKSVYLKKAYKPPRMDTFHCSLPLPKISCKKFQKKKIKKICEKFLLVVNLLEKFPQKLPPPPNWDATRVVE